ncbi:hypothetical protein SLEP1_g24595 [Rubroshorea leprosula]|uniref:Uncharacterized protein n=1 Tax=Rubroshorea leprosula TaxID=152421 RepID=A0AAV5JME3_9ROSI|nr:hypothetical protein SLEP1_g24595 [Rubroshorea leprosula]
MTNGVRKSVSGRADLHPSWVSASLACSLSSPDGSILLHFSSRASSHSLQADFSIWELDS